MTPAAAPETILHASCVVLGGRGLLILGPSGAGKSSLALQLMAFGCGLVADDRTLLRAEAGHLVASCPARIAGRIEAWGLGILPARPDGPVPLVAAVDLGIAETRRLPPERQMRILGVPLPVLHNVASPAFPAALLHYLKAGRAA